MKVFVDVVMRRKLERRRGVYILEVAEFERF